MDLLFSMLSIMFGAIVSTVFTLFSQDQIVFLIAKYLPSNLPFLAGRTIQVSGLWEFTYPDVHCEEGGQPRMIKHLIVLRQVGTTVVGKIAHDQPGAPAEYSVTAKIHVNRYLSGTFSDLTRDPRYGTFQLYVLEDENRRNHLKVIKMKGKWIGFSVSSNENTIRTGEWVWECKDRT